ncbi:MAG: UPF0175 family protein [Halobacteria archaeon]
MSDKHVTTRVPEDIYDEIERIREEERTDRSTAVKKLLERGIESWKLSTAVEKYRLGEISLGKAAEIADVGIWEFMEILRDRGIEPSYSEDDLEQDIELVSETEK